MVWRYPEARSTTKVFVPPWLTRNPKFGSTSQTVSCPEAGGFRARTVISVSAFLGTP